MARPRKSSGEPAFTIRRLDLDQKAVKATRLRIAATGLKNDETGGAVDPEFRPMLDYAVSRYLPVLASHLKALGFARRETMPRQRPVTDATWGKLEKLAKQYDLRVVQLIRACLTLLEREVTPQLESPAPIGADGGESAPPT